MEVVLLIDGQGATTFPVRPGIERGVLHATIEVAIDVAGEFQFEVWLVDKGGRKSNSLFGVFTVVLPDRYADLDLDFGDDGVVVKLDPADDFSGTVAAIAIQDDGMIVVVSNDHPDIVVHRYHADGTLGEDFGLNGEVRFEPDDLRAHRASDVAIQPDGKIVIVGDGGASGLNPGNVLLIRLDEDGLLDPSFSGGFVRTGSGDSGEERGHVVKIQPDGKIVVAGERIEGRPDFKVFIARHESDGSVDTAFGDEGIVLYEHDGADYHSVSDMVIQDDGRIVLAGRAWGASGIGWSNLVIIRMEADGTPDETFADAAAFYYPINRIESVSVALQSDQRIVASGSKFPGSTSAAAFALRLETDGVLDTEFGDEGIYYGDDWFITQRRTLASDLVITEDDRIVLVGSLEDPLVIVLEPDGEPDLDFSRDGLSVIDLEG
ncbi:MAG: hypothetical protein JRG89_24380, partial [Deltaproteobacteria bacterium]|nr:hypothetical protein [Deltaproteobacteria bacterium]